MLVNYSVEVKCGGRVAIQGENIATPLINAVYKNVLQAGGHPIIMPRSMATAEMLFRYGSREQMAYVHEVQRIIMEKYDVRIVILGGENSKALSNVPSDKMAWHDLAYAELMKTMMQRTARGEFRWVIAPYPTASRFGHRTRN